MNDWVTLITFNWLAEALVFKGKLESSGIEVLIPEEHMGTINPGVTGMHVRVQVRESQLEKARKLLDEKADEHESSVCTGCGSPNLELQKAPVRRNLIRAVLGFLFLIPMRPVSRTKRCRNCGKINIG